MHATWTSYTFDQILVEWNELLSNSFVNEIFLTHVWQHNWWKKFGSSHPNVLFGLKENSQLIGIAPLIKTNETITFIGGSDLFDYHDFVVMRGKEDLFYGKLVELIQEIGFSDLDLTSIPEHSPTLELFSQKLRSIGIYVNQREEDVAPVLKLQNTWEEYLQHLNKKNRHEIKRKIRKLDSAGSYTHDICSHLNTQCDCMDDFIRLMKLSNPVKSNFLTPIREEFFRTLPYALSETGFFKLNFLKFENARVASCISFEYNNTVYLYNSGYDPDLSHLSIGLINTIMCIKHAIQSKHSTFDFLRGSERYKYHLGASNRHLYHLRATRQSS